MSAFAKMLDELTAATGPSVARYWREDPSRPHDSPRRWTSWLDGGDFVAFGRSGEESLGNLLSIVIAPSATTTSSWRNNT